MWTFWSLAVVTIEYCTGIDKRSSLFVYFTLFTGKLAFYLLYMYSICICIQYVNSRLKYTMYHVKINPCMNWHQFRHGSITYIHPQFTCTYLCLAGWPRYIFGKRGSLYFLQFTLFKVHTCTYVHALVYLHGFVKFQNFPQQTVIKSAMQMITFMSMIINVVCTCMCIIRWGGGGKYAILKTT